MATKSVSTFTIFCILFLVIFEVPEIKAQDTQCLKEYGGDVGFSYCAPRIFPTLCYWNCRRNKGAKGGQCNWQYGAKCFCDFCSDRPYEVVSESYM